MGQYGLNAESMLNEEYDGSASCPSRISQLGAGSGSRSVGENSQNLTVTGLGSFAGFGRKNPS